MKILLFYKKQQQQQQQQQQQHINKINNKNTHTDAMFIN